MALGLNVQPYLPQWLEMISRYAVCRDANRGSCLHLKYHPASYLEFRRSHPDSLILLLLFSFLCCVSPVQLRIHDSQGVHLYVLVASGPVIEDCNRLMFAPWGAQNSEHLKQLQVLSCTLCASIVNRFVCHIYIHIKLYCTLTNFEPF